jgi:hypothetical protein
LHGSQILALPPGAPSSVPVRKIIGDLSNTERAGGLDIQPIK